MSPSARYDAFNQSYPTNLINKLYHLQREAQGKASISTNDGGSSYARISVTPYFITMIMEGHYLKLPQGELMLIIALALLSYNRTD